jgi:hypothetical protein
MSVRGPFSCLLLATMAACAGPKETPISPEAIGAVIADVKQEVGDFQATSRYLSAHPKPDTSDLQDPFRIPPDVEAARKCGKPGDDLNFLISKVKMDLTTTSDATTNADVSVTVPVAAPVPIAPGGSLSTSKEKQGTQKLTFLAYPAAISSTDTDDPKIGAKLQVHGPITSTLLNLRKELSFYCLSVLQPLYG